MPLDSKRFHSLKTALKPYEYKVIEEAHGRVLVFKTPNRYPDIVNDIEEIVERIRYEDAEDLAKVCIIGEQEVLGIEAKILDALIKNRKKRDNKIITDARKTLTEFFSPLPVKDDEDEHSLERYALRIPGDANKYQMFISKFPPIPKSAAVIYIIGDTDYVRIFGEDFFKIPTTKEEIIKKCKEKFILEGYEIIQLDIPDINIDMALKKGDYRAILRYCENCSIEQAKLYAEEAGRLRSDVYIIVSGGFSKDVKAYALGKKIELIEIDKIEELCI